MSNKNVTVSQSGGIGFCGILAIIFILLKLFGLTAVATWSWLWVLSPLWLPITIVLSIFLIGLVIGLLGLLIATKLK